VSKGQMSRIQKALEARVAQNSLVPASGSRPDIVPRAFNTKIRQKYNTIA
jgi:hypothetical protein